MDFALSEEQRMLQESVSRLLEAECTLDKVREVAEAGGELSPEVHQQLAELGITGILIPEDHGGVGLGFLEAA